jgi:hypothetical protein
MHLILIWSIAVELRPLLHASRSGSTLPSLAISQS